MKEKNKSLLQHLCKEATLLNQQMSYYDGKFSGKKWEDFNREEKDLLNGLRKNLKELAKLIPERENMCSPEVDEYIHQRKELIHSVVDGLFRFCALDEIVNEASGIKYFDDQVKENRQTQKMKGGI